MKGKGSGNLRNEWKEIPQEKIIALHQSLTQEAPPKEELEYPAWFNGRKINEVMFCDAFLNRHPMRCVNGILYDMEGQLNEAALRNELYEAVSPYLSSNVAIHLNNGTYYIQDRRFSEEKEFCLNRLPVRYNPEAPLPVRWLAFLEGLLWPEDIPTLQEFMGYCLIPTNKAQKMLMLVGNGGEGKSRIGRVLRALLGDNMNTCSIQKLACNRFARADQEGKLLMLDDDMKMDALPDTETLKAIITMEDKMDLERKGRQSVQGHLYVRLIGFGNGSLSALYDRSDGFYRRQLVLQVRDRPEDRVDDTSLGDRLRGEAEGILLWCLEGLHRLIESSFVFTISQRTQRNMEEIRKTDNNVLDFLESTGYIMFEPNTHATTRQLYRAYLRWCEDNADKPLAEKTFGNSLRQSERKWHIAYDKNLDIGHGKRARGYRGVNTLVNVD